MVTDGTDTACSMLYGAAAKAAKAMGFRRIQTFTLETEPGTSLKASGWINDGLSNKDGGRWDTHIRQAVGGQQRGVVKVRWIRQLRQVPSAFPADGVRVRREVDVPDTLDVNSHRQSWHLT